MSPLILAVAGLGSLVAFLVVLQDKKKNANKGAIVSNLLTMLGDLKEFRAKLQESNPI